MSQNMAVKRGKWDTRDAESGAAAVEFALVSILLFNLLFGILQYGLYFNDSLNTRQGLREAARMGVVENFTMTGCTTGDNSQKLACIVTMQIAPNTGKAYAKVLGPTGNGNWKKGTPLIVCAAVKEGTYGILPLPGGGWIYSKVQMSIEQEASSASWPATPYADTATGLNWSNAGC